VDAPAGLAWPSRHPAPAIADDKRIRPRGVNNAESDFCGGLLSQVYR